MERDPRFADYHASLTPQAAIAEANRCLFCFDAPCAGACPTHINVPQFIARIAEGNVPGAARTILTANVLGDSCARACPVEVLCEGACVLHHEGRMPIQIGLLQRHAMESGPVRLPFEAGAETGKRVAMIGAGPASLACAAELRKHGVAVVIFDARPLPGGLNTYGVAEYKLPMGVALADWERIAALGVEMRSNETVDAARLAEIESAFDAVFVGVGLGAVHRLGVERDALAVDALDLIADYKRGSLTEMRGRVVVVGAGNTAVDAAIAAKRLGASEVTMLYRRGPESVPAFAFEIEHARAEGVLFRFHSQVRAVRGVEKIEAIEVEEAGEVREVPVEHLVLAIGQAAHTDFLRDTLKLERGRVVVDRATGQSSNPNYFAGGDCTNGGREVVDAVADGKRAGVAMAAMLLGSAHANA